MHKISSPGATQQNTFTEGDASTGVAATEVSASWLNATQSELINIINEAGIEPSENPEADPGNQVIQAILSLISGSISVDINGSSGCANVGDVFKIQWGRSNGEIEAGQSQRIAFTKPFNNFRVCVPSVYRTSDASDENNSLSWFRDSDSSVILRNNGNGARTIYFIALGI